MKLYDCFIFNGENFILDLRLNILNDFVEKFVIVESKYDHQGNKKNLKFKKENFKKFNSKINYKIIENFPENYNDWERENYQRNFIVNGLTEADDEDYIMISDVDEIPNIENLIKIKDRNFVAFKQRNFNLKINLLNKTYPDWYGTRLCKKKYLKSPQWIRSQKVKPYSIFNFYRIKWNIIENGGWHFSFLMTPEDIVQKIKSFAHSEYNNEYFKDLKRINEAIKNNKDIFDRNQNYIKVNLDSSFPKFIINNVNKYNNWII